MSNKKQFSAAKCVANIDDNNNNFNNIVWFLLLQRFTGLIFGYGYEYWWLVANKL